MHVMDTLNTFSLLPSVSDLGTIGQVSWRLETIGRSLIPKPSPVSKKRANHGIS